MDFGERLKYLRTQKGLTQSELAKILNKSRSTIAGYEVNDRFPDFETLQRIATYFNISTDFLLIGRKIPKEHELGEYIKAIRENQNLTLEELSSKTGLHSEILDKIENGEFTPQQKHIKLISLALKVSYNELIDKSGLVDDRDVDVSDILIEHFNEKEKVINEFYSLLIDAGELKPGEQLTGDKKEKIFSMIRLAIQISKIGESK